MGVEGFAFACIFLLPPSFSGGSGICTLHDNWAKGGASPLSLCGSAPGFDLRTSNRFLQPQKALLIFVRCSIYSLYGFEPYLSHLVREITPKWLVGVAVSCLRLGVRELLCGLEPHKQANLQGAKK